jgi:hypothetical protein
MKGRQSGYHRDERGSSHILEVMIVGLMVAGSIIAVSTMNQPTDAAASMHARSATTNTRSPGATTV